MDNKSLIKMPTRNKYQFYILQIAPDIVASLPVLCFPA